MKPFLFWALAVQSQKWDFSHFDEKIKNNNFLCHLMVSSQIFDAIFGIRLKISDVKSRPGFEAGPRPIWAYQARPETRPSLGLAEA
jgi:hypothetical protein